MRLLGHFKIMNMPLAARIWMALASSFHNFSQAVCEFCDNAISNFCGNADDPALVRVIRIDIQKRDAYVDVSIEDGGTGIKDLNNAMTLGGMDARESPMNEHDFGLKHSLAYVEGRGSSWQVSTRTREDANLNRYQTVKAPYDFGNGAISGEYREGWIGTLGDTGTVISFSCPMNVFATLDSNSKKTPPFQDLVAILKENLRYTYSDLLESQKAAILLVSEEDSVRQQELLRPLLPPWDSSVLRILPAQTYDLGGGPIQIHCRYGDILASKENLTHYLGNMESSGVEICINGRVIEQGLLKRIWGRKIHPSQNSFLVRINLETDSLSAVPSTKTAKNGFREEDPLLKELFRWIRSNVDLSHHTTETQEQNLVRKLAEKLDTLPGMTRVTREFGVFRVLDLNERVDLLTCQDNKITIYEGKAKATSTNDLYQLRKYWDGCVLDGIPPEDGVLIAARHPKDVQKLVDFLNSQTGSDDRPYRLRLTTWKDEGISVP